MLKKRIIIKTFYSALILLLFTVAAAAADQIYVRMLADARAPLSGGGIITMDKDDCFQFIGYDSSQKLVHLRVDQFTFWTSKDNVQFVAKADTASAAEKCAADAKKFLAARQVVIQRRH